MCQTNAGKSHLWWNLGWWMQDKVIRPVARRLNYCQNTVQSVSTSRIALCPAFRTPFRSPCQSCCEIISWTAFAALVRWVWASRWHISQPWQVLEYARLMQKISTAWYPAFLPSESFCRHRSYFWLQIGSRARKDLQCQIQDLVLSLTLSPCQ